MDFHSIENARIHRILILIILPLFLISFFSSFFISLILFLVGLAFLNRGYDFRGRDKKIYYFFLALGLLTIFSSVYRIFAYFWI